MKPNLNGKIFTLRLGCLVLFLTIAAPLRAQVVSDGATNTLNNVTNQVTGTMTVGTNGSFTLLTITNGAFLSNTLAAVIGRNTGANSNRVWLTGAGSRWLVGGELFVGSNGSFNRLIVSNGAGLRVSNTAWIGLAGTSGSNEVVVTGNGSTWTNLGSVVVGSSGDGNRLTVSAGGLVTNAFDGLIGYFAGSDTNEAVVTGAGSRWLVERDVYVGRSGASNRLTISTGGLLASSNGYLGYTALSSNNEAIVSGTNSTWTNALDMLVGVDGSWNRLVISNGALVGDRHGELGLNASSRSNEAVVTGIGSYWSNRGSMSIGVSGSGNRLIVSNGGLVGNLDGYFGDFTTGSGTNTAIVTGTGSLWSNRGDLYLGLGSSGNQLIVSNGGGVFVGNGAYLGYGSTGGTNSALITDAGSYWRVANELDVGLSNRANRVVISNGASLLVSNAAYVGMNTGTVSNEVVVTGTNSSWTNAVLYLGYTGAGSRMVISNGGVVGSGTTYVGLLSSSGSNQVVVTGAGSRWTNSTELTVGNNSAGNSLTIANGGRVDNVDGYIGRNATTASNNVVAISGVGSIWNNLSNLVVGDVGPGNRLILSNEGVARSLYGDIGREPFSSNNEVLVTGSNSTWLMTAELNVGVNGPRNRLTVSNGGTVFNTTGRVGEFSDNNTAVVTGAGSLWNNSSLAVGVVGSTNLLVITNNGTVRAVGGVTIGANTFAANNTLTLGGGNLVVTNAAGSAAITVGKDGEGTLNFNGGTIVADRLFVTNNGPSPTNINSIFNFNYGDLTTLHGSVVTQATSFLIGTTAGQTATWTMLGGTNTVALAAGSDIALGHVAGSRAIVTVSGPSTIWSNTTASELFVGEVSSSNQLLVSNGASLRVSNTAWIGLAGTSGSNEVVVTGNGSTWTNLGSVVVGSSGDGNRLTVSAGGLVTNAFDGLIGYFAGSDTNEAVVTGAGSRWLVERDLYVGRSGASNRLTISAGGQVFNDNGVLGFAAGSSNNLALVTGTNSLWTNASSLTIGDADGGNQLLVSNGGVVANGTGYLGVSAAAGNNTALVTDAGSFWNNTNHLFVGYGSSGNRLVISNGALVGNNYGELGFLAGSTSNEVVVTGTNSFWSNRADVAVGVGGTDNRLIISGGALVTGESGYLADAATSSNNTAIVTGANSLWSNRVDFYLGHGGGRNQLVVSNGGGVSVSNDAYLGYTTNGAGNTAWVTGSNSFWTIGDKLYVGNSNSGNRLVVTNGGALRSTWAYIGEASSADGNQIIVTGTNSAWTNGATLRIGDLGSFNTLLISNGGTVRSDSGLIGFQGISSNNLALVTGAGSLWSNANDLYVGILGSGNQLIISNGGRVRSFNGTVGSTVLSSNNVALVAGANSLWSNANTLVVGDDGAGNWLVVSNGGVAAAGNGYVGHGSNSLNNVAVVTGTGSLWSNRLGLYVGYDGRNNTLMVSNNGTVTAGSVYVGHGTNALGNVLTIAGGNLVGTNANGTVLTVGLDGQGTLDFNGGTIVANQLLVTNNGPGYTNSVFNFNYGDLTTLNGSVIAQRSSFLIGNTSNQTASWLISGGTNTVALGGSGSYTILGNVAGACGIVSVTGPNCVWSNNGNLYVGYAGSFNTVLITNGARVENASGGIGLQTIANNNQVIVTGPNSWLVNRGFLDVGGFGSFNSLVISNGGTVKSYFDVRAGLSASASNNQITVTGTNSLMDGLNQYLIVGNDGSFNTLFVTNAGHVASDICYIGGSSGGNNNQAIVTGTNSVWTNFSILYVGRAGSSNTLQVSNGGEVVDAAGTLGLQAGANDNAAFVSGPGSWWNHGTSLLIGDAGASSRLVVSNGGLLSDRFAVLGNATGSSNNFVLVTDSGSIWSNLTGLTVGATGSVNTVVVSNGGLIASPVVIVGSNAASLGNILTVAGGILVGTNANGSVLNIGRDGQGTLNFNGGTIVANQLFVTNNGPGYTNSIFDFNYGDLTTRNGSRIDYSNRTSNNANFAIGTSRSGTTEWQALGGTNVLLVGPGADVAIGSNASATFMISGPGTIFTNNSVDFIVGLGAVTNSRLIVTNGAKFFGPSLDIGDSSGKSNLVLITGPGSAATIGAADIFMRSSNLLVVADGGRLESLTAGIGAGGGTGGNTVVVTNAGSLWTNRDDLNIGKTTSSNRLFIRAGGLVQSGEGYLGRGAGSSGNQLVVDGVGSRWTIATNLVVGSTGAVNTVTLTNSGQLSVGGSLVLGETAASGGNVLAVRGGQLAVTNALGSARLTVGQGGEGTLNFNGGTIVADQLFVTNGANSVFNFNGGALNVRTAVVANTQTFFIGNGTSNATMNLVGNGTHSFANNLTIRSNAALLGTGSVIGSITNYGTLGPGFSPGAVTIKGDLRLQPSSTLSFELGGLIATNDYDVVNVTNFVQFAGTLSLSLLNNFLPNDSDTFTLVSFGSASGTFANLSGGRVSLTNNLASFTVTQTATNFVLGGVRYTDSDGDGQGDLQEQAAGTDPNNSASALAVISITQNGSGHNVLLFQSVPGRNYRIEYSNDLVTWSTATTNVPSTGASTPWTDNGALTGGQPGTQRFYRVGLQ